MKYVILKPRLDVPFKNLGPVPKERGPIPPIRVHWENAVEKMKSILLHNYVNVEVEIIEAPLWQFTEDYVNSIDADWIYIPHREAKHFKTNTERRSFYMQSVFPWRFYVDGQGYAGEVSWRQDLVGVKNGKYSSTSRKNYEEYLRSGKSKFDQPTSGQWKAPQNYILFTCQLPHDHTIAYHSSVTVEGALRMTIEAAEKLGKFVVVKSHPLNPASQEGLKQYTQSQSNAYWIETCSILDAIDQSDLVVTVNSGTGMEALALGKPVATFGRADYDIATTWIANRESIERAIENPHIDMNVVDGFFEMFDRRTLDTRPATQSALIGAIL